MYLCLLCVNMFEIIDHICLGQRITLWRADLFYRCACIFRNIKTLRLALNLLCLLKEYNINRQSSNRVGFIGLCKAHEIHLQSRNFDSISFFHYILRVFLFCSSKTECICDIAKDNTVSICLDLCMHYCICIPTTAKWRLLYYGISTNAIRLIYLTVIFFILHDET